ncbi:MAG: potassium channel family protein [Acidobacteriota bacterium]
MSNAEATPPPKEREPQAVSPAANESLWRRIFGWGWIVAIITGIVTAATWYAGMKDVEGGAPYTALLLLVSPILLIIGGAWAGSSKPPWHIGSVYLALELWKALLTFVYCRGDRFRTVAEGLSFVAIAIGCVVLTGILVIARLTINYPKRQEAIRRHFFAAICGALYLFSHVAYDLTFALALHDRRGLESALEGPALDAKPILTKVTTYTLPFTERSAHMKMDVVQQLGELITKWPASADDQRILLRERPELKDSDEAVIEGARLDIIEWKSMLERIRSEKPEWWRITVVGHASDSLAAQEGAQKNLALSEERIEQVRAFIQRELKILKPDVRIEWRLRAVSNDDRFVATKYREGINHKLHVEVVIESGRPFELLDYAYFMIYTITTTGYGDIVPISARAKFITSLANIFELMFIVVLLNLVVIYGQPGREATVGNTHS